MGERNSERECNGIVTCKTIVSFHLRHFLKSMLSLFSLDASDFTVLLLNIVKQHYFIPYLSNIMLGNIYV